MRCDKKCSYSFIVLCIAGLIAGCSHYRIVELEKFYTDSSEGGMITTYAATHNNMIIPEYTIDRTGHYPVSRLVAEDRLQERLPVLRPSMEVKYRTEHDIFYTIKRTFFTIGQIIVSPIVMPIILLSDDPGTQDNREKRESFLQRCTAAFHSLITEPVPQKPILRDKLSPL